MHKKLALQIKFQTFNNKIGWRLSDAAKSIEVKNDFMQLDAISNDRDNYNLDRETESLKQVKKLLDAYPLELESDELNGINVETVLKYKNYI